MLLRLAFVTLTLLATPALAGALPETVQRALTQAGIADDNVTVWVQPVDADSPTISHNADRPMNPASVMKLVTAFAAFERLGPAYTWTTRVATDGTLDDGALAGNLYLIGGGDPMLDVGRLYKLLARVRASGITHVAGDIVLDASALRLPPHDEAAFDNRPLRPYNSGANALLANFNTVQLHLTPGGRPGEPVAVAAVPALEGVEFDTRIVTSDGFCGAWWSRLDAVPDGGKLVLTGTLPIDCGPRDWAVAPLPTEAFTERLVARLWRDAGGTLSGQVRSATTLPTATTLFAQDSVPLAEAVREMNKWSSNVIARQVLATLAIDDPSSVDMIATGAWRARDTLAAAGVPTQGLVIENGSGLSRSARIRADALGALLIQAWKRPWMPEFVSSLSIAGLDGTARKRLADSPANGQAHLKTGTINGVRAMAGYVLDRDGRRHAVVMMVNDAKASRGEAAQDGVVEWVWGGAGK
ncbi:D-alanyl-D-alanine carboxypeptidase/D-alanyl-D-alanine endopeptidase [Pseudazoarcus pumilus]|uniref:D-alanyl-D-alanine carboxypeptidase/D-alanyl-D-alanine-endopeptidase n=1 Tax=Pseudazoarcus pumilus TaxID=2067960 RepID=A0A2I6S2S4_9RHOO|nr:D-alanyl-D-alanine carboxypeptidase/D-alanyl-D-alanine-endopeptidase [Pseudazoarcus pumilus]AUN93570.1 D-alanyl-D-alanine carboxypeptidase/D-alanyl-D-alanine-endopeptidase [Pseudazoarcus pumilus]